MAVSEERGEVVFLHRIVPGGADKSYGIHVAQLAGLPRAVISRAWEVLTDLEGDGRGESRSGAGRVRKATALQMPLFGEPSPLVDELSEIDISSMTPLEAINLLYELQKKAVNSSGKKNEAEGIVDRE